MGNNKDAGTLIEHLRARYVGAITIIDEDMESGLRKDGDLTYASKEYVEAI